MTGGYYSATTEILATGLDQVWKVLKNGNLPWFHHGIKLATIDNEVFSFGK